MLGQFQNMFAPVAHLLESQAAFVHHPTLQAQWKEDLQEVNELLEDDCELSHTDMKSIKKIQEIFIYGAERFLERAVNQSWQALSVDEKKNRVNAILSRPQIPQRTPEWYLQGQQVLTASEFETLYASERAYASLVITKSLPPVPRTTSRLACPTAEMSPFDWGIRFEPVVKSVFESAWAVKIAECGRVTHSKDTNLAASPDGLIVEGSAERLGRLVEIKCPISREIGGAIPFAYWCQMQIQMEVTSLDECEYLEVKIESAQARKRYEPPTETPFASGTLYLFKKDEEYTYSYTDGIKEGWTLEETIPWHVAAYHTVTVQRDSQWFQQTASLREQFWKDVAEAKAGTFKVPAPTGRAKACKIQDTPLQVTPPS